MTSATDVAVSRLDGSMAYVPGIFEPSVFVETENNDFQSTVSQDMET